MIINSSFYCLFFITFWICVLKSFFLHFFSKLQVVSSFQKIFWLKQIFNRYHYFLMTCFKYKMWFVNLFFKIKGKNFFRDVYAYLKYTPLGLSIKYNLPTFFYNYFQHLVFLLCISIDHRYICQDNQIICLYMTNKFLELFCLVQEQSLSSYWWNSRDSSFPVN